MSWADDIRCLYCDGKLPLYKKITNGQFCSSSHQKAYWQDQERLALERLRDSYPVSRLDLPATVESVECEEETHSISYAAGGRTASGAIILQAAPQVEPDLRGLLGERWPCPLQPASQIISADPFPYEISLHPSLGAERFWAPFFVSGGQLPRARPVKNAMPLPLWHGPRAESSEISPILLRISPVLRSEVLVHESSWTPGTPLRISATGLLELPGEWLTPREPKRGFAGQARPVTIEARPAFQRSTPLSLEAAPLQIERVEPVERAAPIEQAAQAKESAIPHVEKLCALPRILPSSPFARPTPLQDEVAATPIDLAGRPQIPANGIPHAVASRSLDFADLAQLPFQPAPIPATIDALHRISAEVCPLDVKGEAPQRRLETPARGPRLRPAPGSRYSVESRRSVASLTAQEPATVPAHIPDISLPERHTAACVSMQEDPLDVPAPAGPLPLNFTAESATPAVPETDIKALTIPGRFDTEPLLPRLRLEPQDAKPASDWLRPPAEDPASGVASADKPAARPVDAKSANSKTVTPKSLTPWMHAVDFYKHAPRDLKVLAFAIPVLLSIALNPSAPKVKTTAAGGFPASIQKTLNTGFNDQWVTVRQTVLDRAAVALDEDFRSGLDNWMTRDDVATSWGFDATGFVRPGPLALYEPSVGLSDYQMQFLGVIDKKALSWVVRAADFDNYYVIKLMVLKPGPMPTVGVTRYAVIHGKAQDRSDTILPINARNDMLYRISLDVRGEDFALAVQGQMVDNWSEPRLKHGGVGFFAARGEESRVRWVQVTHQYDMLGRLCAYLAPYNISTTDGGF